MERIQMKSLSDLLRKLREYFVLQSFFGLMTEHVSKMSKLSRTRLYFELTQIPS